MHDINIEKSRKIFFSVATIYDKRAKLISIINPHRCVVESNSKALTVRYYYFSCTSKHNTLCCAKRTFKRRSRGQDTCNLARLSGAANLAPTVPPKVCPLKRSTRPCLRSESITFLLSFRSSKFYRLIG